MFWAPRNTTPGLLSSPFQISNYGSQRYLHLPMGLPFEVIGKCCSRFSLRLTIAETESLLSGKRDPGHCNHIVMGGYRKMKSSDTPAILGREQWYRKNRHSAGKLRCIRKAYFIWFARKHCCSADVMLVKHISPPAIQQLAVHKKASCYVGTRTETLVHTGCTLADGTKRVMRISDWLAEPEVRCRKGVQGELYWHPLWGMCDFCYEAEKLKIYEAWLF